MLLLAIASICVPATALALVGKNSVMTSLILPIWNPRPRKIQLVLQVSMASNCYGRAYTKQSYFKVLRHYRLGT